MAIKNPAFVVLLVILPLLSACDSAALSSTKTPATRPAYPITEPTDFDLPSQAYPVGSTATLSQADLEIVPFELDKPVFAGSDQVTGKGPTGVPVVIADVTLFGDILGSGTIDEDGEFSIDVPVLEANHRIGIVLGDLSNSVWSDEEFSNPAYQGLNAMLVPQVGFFYDTTLVEAK